MLRCKPRKTKLVKYSNQEALVEPDVAPLVMELWKADISTYHLAPLPPRNRLMFGFCGYKTLHKFLDIFNSYNHELRTRPIHIAGESMHLPTKWSYWFSEPDLNSICYVCFPRNDLSIVLASLHRHNEQSQ